MTADNAEVAALLEEFADRLEAKDVDYKPRAYRDAAESVREAPLGALDDPEELKDVGEAIGSKITEYLETGSIEELEELREELPVDIEAVTRVEGVGPKTAGKLYRALGVEDLDDLEEAAEAGRIREVEGFGQKTEQNILEGIDFARQSHERMLLGDALPLSRKVVELVREAEGVERANVAGSIRRRKETIGDLDVVVVSGDREATVDDVAEYAEDVLQRGESKASYHLEETQLDLHMVEDDEFGSALQYFTGSMGHNVVMRQRAIDPGKKLNEYGVWRDDERLASETEEDVYDELGMEFVPPEMREDRGEVEAADSGELPELVEVDDVRGDLHLHVDRCDGSATLEEVAAKAVELGYDYVAVTEHSEALGVVGGLSDEELLDLAEEVGDVEDEHDLRMFTGVEANIMEDGSIDVGDDVLEELDVVVASIHSGLGMDEDEATERLVSAVEHPGVDVVGHPSGRLLNSREGYPYDFDRVLDAADQHGVVLELNANPHRLDVTDKQVKRCREAGVPVSIDTDAHAAKEMEYVEYGVATARRGWAEDDDVLNTNTVQELEEWLGS